MANALYGPGASNKSDYSSLFGGSRKFTPFVIDADSLHQLATSHNKNLRKELLDFRDKRDKFLIKRLDYLKPFLPTKVGTVAGESPHTRALIDLLFM